MFNLNIFDDGEGENISDVNSDGFVSDSDLKEELDESEDNEESLEDSINENVSDIETEKDDSDSAEHGHNEPDAGFGDSEASEESDIQTKERYSYGVEEPESPEWEKEGWLPYTSEKKDPVDSERSVRCEFHGCGELLFDISEVHKRHKRDYNFFLKFQKFNHVTHYVHSKEPHTHLYEKNYWQLNFCNKIGCLLRNKLSPLNSSPFSGLGECPFFEFETLYSPQRCIAYSLRARELSKINLKRFCRSLKVYTADVYEDILIEGIDSFESEIDLGRIFISPGGVKFVEEPCGKDDIPSTRIDRNAWPTAFIDRNFRRG